MAVGVALGSCLVESGAAAGVTAFFGVGFGFGGVVAAAPVALAGVAVDCPALGGFFCSAPDLSSVDAAPAAPDAVDFASPLLIPAFCSVPAAIGLLTLPGVGEDFGGGIADPSLYGIGL